MKTHLLAYVITLVILVGVDFVWLGRMGDAVYRPVMGDMALSGFRAVPAIVLFDLCRWRGLFRGVAGVGGRGGGRRGAQWSYPRPLRLWHLRSHEPSDAQELVDYVERHRHGMGHGAHGRVGDDRLLHRFGHRRTGLIRRPMFAAEREART